MLFASFYVAVLLPYFAVALALVGIINGTTNGKRHRKGLLVSLFRFARASFPFDVWPRSAIKHAAGIWLPVARLISVVPTVRAFDRCFHTGLAKRIAGVYPPDPC